MTMNLQPLTSEHVEGIVSKAHRLKRHEPLRPNGRYTWALSYCGSVDIIEYYESESAARETAKLSTIGQAYDIWRRTGPRTWVKTGVAQSVVGLLDELISMGIPPESLDIDPEDGIHAVLRAFHRMQAEAEEEEGEPPTTAA